MNNQARAQAGQMILDIVTGLDFETAVATQCDALATTIGGAFFENGKSRDEAEQFVKLMAVDMAERHIRRHWGSIAICMVKQ